MVSSAGNTGRAFLQTFSRYGLPALVVVPENALPHMWITGEKHPAVRLAVVRGGGDYSDAIEVGNRIAAQPGFYAEGGARNVARRDGMGTVVLAAAEALGESPRHYFQAVGSGTGAIAAWEMSLRLRGGRSLRSRACRACTWCRASLSPSCGMPGKTGAGSCRSWRSRRPRAASAASIRRS